jgi:2-phosphoglycerate kinase
MLSNSIQASGLPADQSFEIARDIETQLIDSRRGNIPDGELQVLVAGLLGERHGVDYAQRYQVWRAWGDLDKPLVILIGGASGVGKTSLAIDLAHLLNIPRVVATDDIRQIMRLTLAPEFMPAIHTSSYSAWSSLRDSGTSDAVIEGYNEQARVVAVGVQAILARCTEENSSVIIDGVHVLSPYIDLSPTRDAAFVAPLCLAVSDRASYAARFAKRAREAPKRRPNRYLDNLDQIMHIQEYLVGRCVQEDIPVIDADAVEDETSAGVMVVVERLQEQEEVRARLAVNGKNGKPVGKKKKRRRQNADRSSRPQHGKVRA